MLRWPVMRVWVDADGGEPLTIGHVAVGPMGGEQMHEKEEDDESPAGLRQLTSASMSQGMQHRDRDHRPDLQPGVFRG